MKNIRTADYAICMRYTDSTTANLIILLDSIWLCACHVPVRATSKHNIHADSLAESCNRFPCWYLYSFNLSMCYTRVPTFTLTHHPYPAYNWNTNNSQLDSFNSIQLRDLSLSKAFSSHKGGLGGPFSKAYSRACIASSSRIIESLCAKQR